MKRKWFALSTIAIIALFVLQHTAVAHQPVRTQRQARNAKAQALRSRIVRPVNPMTALQHSWVDLTFGVNADAATLAKAAPIYQATRDALQKQLKAARQEVQTDDRRATAKKIRDIIAKTRADFNASLKEVLTEEQMTQLTELTQKRSTELARARRVEVQKRLQRLRLRRER